MSDDDESAAACLFLAGDEGAGGAEGFISAGYAPYAWALLDAADDCPLSVLSIDSVGAGFGCLATWDPPH